MSKKNFSLDAVNNIAKALEIKIDLLFKSPDDEEALFCCTVKGLENFIGSFVKITVEHSKTDGPSKYTITLKG